MSIRRADIENVLTDELEKPHVDISLNIFDEVSDMNVTVGIRQRARDQNSLQEYTSLLRQKFIP